ncbi:MAG: PEP-CTERM sorting domain-containing protein [Opitutaceae bacterium]|nr:PEP-CTERM sorting domain-containing protein [Opitutaceae bacterium]
MNRIDKLIVFLVTLLGLVTANAIAQTVTVTTYNVTLSHMNNQMNSDRTEVTAGKYQAAASLTASNDPSSTWTDVGVTPPLSENPIAMGLGMYNTYNYNAAMPTSAPATGLWAFQYNDGIVHSVNLNVAESFMSAVAVSTSSGSWVSSGGPMPSYAWQIDPSQAITFEWSPPDEYVSGDTVMLTFARQGAPGDPATWSNNTGATDAVFSAGYFQAGASYMASLTYLHEIELLSGGFGGDDQGVAVFQTSTSFQVQAIPEPSTYAALFGLAALGFVAWRRRFA